MNAEVVRLGAHTRMTPEEVLSFCSAEEWGEVIICGYHKGDKFLIVRSSAMTRETAVWILENAKLHSLGVK